MTGTETRGSVLFVSHDASRTGAPVLLASALRWAAQGVAADMDLRLLLLDGGPLLEEYRRILPTRVLGGPLRTTVARLDAAARSLGLPFGPGDVPVGSSSGVGDADVVVANTLVSLPTAAKLARRRGGVRLVCHVHELDGVAGRVLPDGPRRSALADRVDFFIAAGAPVADMLVQRWGVGADRVSVVDEWTEPPPSPQPGPPATPTDPVRPRVLAAGAMRHRKGPDRFVDLMSLVADHAARPVGVWVGGSAESVEAREMRDDVARAVAPAEIEVLADRADAGPLIAAADVFVSTAIEDPYPLVVLEAAAAGVPVAGFDSGGIREVLHAVGQGDALVPVDDVIGLGRVVGRLLDDPAERRRRGDALSDWVRRTHTTGQLAPRWWDAVVG